MATLQIAIVKRSLHHDPHCGDECGHWQSGKKKILCIIDGLGHGKIAEQSAREAKDYVATHLTEPLPDIFSSCNKALRKTRGVAMGIAVIDETTDILTYAGVGNTRAVILGGKTIRLVSNYGIVGGGFKKLTPESVPLNQGDTLILTTDGIEEMLDFSAYGDELLTDVRKLADQIMRDWCKKGDDAAVLVYQHIKKEGIE